MISKCVNPECNAELRYLRTGRLYVREPTLAEQRTAAHPLAVEFFWMCGDCARNYRLNFVDGHPRCVAVKPRVTIVSFLFARSHWPGEEKRRGA